MNMNDDFDMAPGDEGETVAETDGLNNNKSTNAATAASSSAIMMMTMMLPAPPRAAQYIPCLKGADDKRLYWDRSHYDSPASQLKALKQSATLYVGNLAFSTRTRHVRAHFSVPGTIILSIHMGLDRMKKTPCGFCFVEYAHRRDALAAVAHLSGTKLDGKVIRVELDAGFQPGRQYGRGLAGGQVRDDKKDKQRGGSGMVDRKRTRNTGNSNNNSMNQQQQQQQGQPAGDGEEEDGNNNKNIKADDGNETGNNDNAAGGEGYGQTKLEDDDDDGGRGIEDEPSAKRRRM